MGDGETRGAGPSRAVLWIGTGLIAALVLLAAATAVWVGRRLLAGRPGGTPPEPGEPVLSVMQQAYPGWGRDDVELLLRESWLRPYAYEPFTQFKERPFRGRYVNVDEAGFRWSSGQCPWPPDASRGDVFLFGGSTLFGYGVTDADTIPSRLRAVLASPGRSGAACVYNFGRGWYYSSQERVLFERLLVSGLRPARAVFVDGLNEFFYPVDEPRFTEQLGRFVQEINAHLEPGAVPRAPRGQAAPATLAPEGSQDGSPGPASDPAALAASILERYLRNLRLTRAIGDAFDVRTTFVWQAVPVYGYDLARHPFRERIAEARWVPLVRAGYEGMAERRRRDPPPDVVWCADAHAGEEGLLYLDSVHYSPEMCRRMARCIAEGLR